MELPPHPGGGGGWAIDVKHVAIRSSKDSRFQLKGVPLVHVEGRHNPVQTYSPPAAEPLPGDDYPVP